MMFLKKVLKIYDKIINGYILFFIGKIINNKKILRKLINEGRKFPSPKKINN